MSAKRKPVELDASAFEAAAVPQLNPVDQLAVPDAPKPSPQREREPPKRRGKSANQDEAAFRRQASRVGKVQVQTWVAEETRVELRVISARQRRTIEDLMQEAIEGLIKKYARG